ncbi:cardiolipin synthase [Paenibacillus psychroresistens]|uniref:Cardiolipin synthase n=1 Tax=Paenibacillus psychroresistens TaxID=1778678 RepID=A0A6B8RRT0_9BACL|nr:cardiolipin synthase [Paenibacillus psychroresistens]QGQ98514.1 cardiolipin synthase [Paenibacillus psychroresistens]
MVWVIIVLLLFIFQIMTILVAEFRYPSKTVAWLVILFIFPLIGFVMYYFMAKTYSQKRKSKRKGQRVMKEIRRDLQKIAQRSDEADVPLHGVWKHQRLFGLLHNLPGCVICKHNSVTTFAETKEMFDALKSAIEAAKDHIHFQFYTIRNDLIGTEFQQLLIRKAQEGVKVRVLYDGIGSYSLPKGYVKELTDAGAEVHSFLDPLIAFIDKRLNYRNHRKIVVIDGTVGFFGGVNVGDEYLGGNPKLGYWRDTHFQLEGNAVYFLQNTFLTDWCFASGAVLSDSRYYPELLDKENNQWVQIVTSGPDEHWDAILEVYFAAITTAQQRIHIASPYFVPDASIFMALKMAAISGIEVKIIFPLVPDSELVHLASLSYMEELMQAGVVFYQYAKGFIHSKILIIDDTIAFVGTANLDMRSFFSNFELNAVMFDNKVIGQLEADFRQDLLDSKLMILEEFRKRSRFEKAKEAFARTLSPLL